MEELDKRSRSQQWSDNIAEFCGSWGFVFWFSLFILIWMLLNTVLFLTKHFDEYPFILLNLFLTVISTMQSPIIMMAQNRQVERDRDNVNGIHAKLNILLSNTQE